MSASDYVEERRKIDLEKLKKSTEELQSMVIEALESHEPLPGWMSKDDPGAPKAPTPSIAAIWKRYKR